MRLTASLFAACAAAFCVSPALANSESVTPLRLEQRIPVTDGAAAVERAADWLMRRADGAVHLQLVDPAEGMLFAQGSTAVAPDLPLAAKAVAGQVSWRLELVLEGGEIVARVTDLVHETDATGLVAVDLGMLTLADDPGEATCGTSTRRTTPCIRGRQAVCVVQTCDEAWRTRAWSGVREAVTADIDALLAGLAGAVGTP